MGKMRALIVDDEFTSRHLLRRFLCEYGECDFAVDGEEAIEAFRYAHKLGEPYHLICMDIMTPRMDGISALAAIRKEEAALGIHGLEGVKVIMTTGRSDKEAVLSSFREGCEAYLEKPLSKEKLIENLKRLGLVS